MVKIKKAVYFPHIQDDGQRSVAHYRIITTILSKTASMNACMDAVSTFPEEEIPSRLALMCSGLTCTNADDVRRLVVGVPEPSLPDTIQALTYAVNSASISRNIIRFCDIYDESPGILNLLVHAEIHGMSYPKDTDWGEASAMLDVLGSPELVETLFGARKLRTP